MDPKKILRGKRVLVVDDEKDVLEFLVEILDMCKIDKASTFEEAKDCHISGTLTVAVRTR